MSTLLDVEVWAPPPAADEDLPSPRRRPHTIAVSCPQDGCNVLAGWIRDATAGLDFDHYGRPWEAESPEHMPGHVEHLRRAGEAARWVLHQHDLDVHLHDLATDRHQTRQDQVVHGAERLAIGITDPDVASGSCLRCSATLSMLDGVWSDPDGLSWCPEPADLCPNLCSPHPYGRATSCPHCHGTGDIFDLHHPIPDIVPTQATGARQDEVTP